VGKIAVGFFGFEKGFAPAEVGKILDTAIDFLSNVVPSMVSVTSLLQGAVSCVVVEMFNSPEGVI